MSKSITGRDGYIVCKALCYAIEAIARLPEKWQELSDAEDMKLIRDAMFHPTLIETCRDSAVRHLDQKPVSPEIAKRAAS